MSQKELPTSRHFKIEEIRDGVYTIIHVDGGAAISNAGIVDLGDRTLIFDTLFSPLAAEEMRIAVEKLTGRPAHTIINSHEHYDHFWGNSVFDPGVNIVAPIKAYQAMVEEAEAFLREYRRNVYENLQPTIEQYEAAENKQERMQLRSFVDLYQGFIDADDRYELILPNQTFDKRLCFHGSKRSAELVEIGNGHSKSDAILILPEDRIVFMSDLLFVEHHPLIGGDYRVFLQAMDDVAALEPKVLVPGHGSVAGVDALLSTKQYIQTLIQLAQELINQGEREQVIGEVSIPRQYTEWRFNKFFAINLRFVFQQLAVETGAS